MKFPEQFRASLSMHGAPPAVAGDPFGTFQVTAHKAPGRRTLNIIACDGAEVGWDHVSISVHNSTQTPTWAEMCFVKDLFWDKSECVVQFHPPESDYVNHHPGVLHLWKQVGTKFPMPPKICV